MARKEPPIHSRANFQTMLGLTLAGLLAAGPTGRLTWAMPDSGVAEAASPPAEVSKAFRGHLPITELNETEAILHALNRLGYGPRPGDVERVRQMSLEKWIEQQIHPESINDATLAAR